jgi:transcriptional regulator with XRE-family HTH domain
VKPETLAQRVKRLMTERRLNAAEVAKRSGNAITDSYVDHLAVGRYTNLSVEKLKALAEGLGDDPVNLFRVAAGSSPEEIVNPWPTYSELTESIGLLLKMNARQLDAAKRALNGVLEDDHLQRRSRKKFIADEKSE